MNTSKPPLGSMHKSSAAYTDVDLFYLMARKMKRAHTEQYPTGFRQWGTVQYSPTYMFGRKLWRFVHFKSEYFFKEIIITSNIVTAAYDENSVRTVNFNDFLSDGNCLGK